MQKLMLKYKQTRPFFLLLPHVYFVKFESFFITQPNRSIFKSSSRIHLSNDGLGRCQFGFQFIGQIFGFSLCFESLLRCQEGNQLPGCKDGWAKFVKHFTAKGALIVLISLLENLDVFLLSLMFCRYSRESNRCFINTCGFEQRFIVIFHAVVLDGSMMPLFPTRINPRVWLATRSFSRNVPKASVAFRMYPCQVSISICSK